MAIPTEVRSLSAAASMAVTDVLLGQVSGRTLKITPDVLPFVQSGSGASARTVQAKAREWVSVTDFGATGDGTTDDTTAFSNAKTSLATRGGGVLVVPETTSSYVLSTLEIDSSWNNITIFGLGKPTLVSSNAAPMFKYSGYSTNEYAGTGAVLTGVARMGKFAVTLNNGSDPNVPSQGDMVLVMSSRNADSSAVPYGEWNIVSSVSGTTVNLLYPLRHTYTAPVNQSGYAYQVLTLGDHPKHFGIENFILQQSTNAPFEVHGMFIKTRNVHIKSPAALLGRGRFLDYEYTAEMANNWSARRPYAFAVDTTSSDFRAVFTATSDGLGIVHLHEGVCFGSVDADVNCGETDASKTESWGVISLGAGIHDLSVDAKVRNAPGGYGFVNSGGVIFTDPGGQRVSVDVKGSGKADTSAFRANTGQFISPILLKAMLDGAESPSATVFSETAADPVFATDLLAFPISLDDATATGSGSVDTDAGESVVTLPDSGTSGFYIQADLPQRFLNYRKCRVIGEIETLTDANNVLAIRADVYFVQGPVGVTISSYGTRQVSRFPTIYGVNSFVYVSATFNVSPNRHRCLFRIERIPAAGSDTLSGDVRVRRLWAVFFDPIYETGNSEDKTTISTAVGNVGTGEDNLMTYSLPASSFFTNNQAVKIKAWGTTANNSNTKTVKLYFGSTAILTTALTVSQAGKWAINAEVISTGTDTQDYASQLTEYGTATQLDMENGTATEDDGAAITIKCTGTVADGGGGVNNNDIVQEGMVVEFLR